MADTAENSHPIRLSALVDLKKVRHRALRVAGSFYRIDGTVSQRDPVSIPYLMVWGKQLRGCKFPHIRAQCKLTAFPEHLRIFPSQIRLRTTYSLQKARRTEVIVMPMGMQNDPDVPRIKSQLVYGVQFESLRRGIPRVDQDDSVSRIYKIGAYVIIPDEIQLPADTKGLYHVPFGKSIVIRLRHSDTPLLYLYLSGAAMSVHIHNDQLHAGAADGLCVFLGNTAVRDDRIHAVDRPDDGK